MKKFLFIFALIFIVFSSQIFAEENLKEEYCSSAVGFNQQFNLSGAYTMGLTYQNYFDNNWGIQASLGAIVNETVYYSADIQLQRLFLVNNFLNKRKQFWDGFEPMRTSRCSLTNFGKSCRSEFLK